MPPLTRPGKQQLDVKVSGPVETLAARFLTHAAPWIVWIGGLPVGALAFWLLGHFTHHQAIVVVSLAAATAVTSWVVWHFSHSRGGGRLHHAINTAACLGWVTLVTWHGLTSLLLITYMVGGLVLVLTWNVRYTPHGDSAEDAIARRDRAKRVEVAYAVRAATNRVPIVRASAERVGRVIPAVAAPWQAPAVEGGQAPAALPAAGPDAKAADTWARILRNFRRLAAAQPDLAGARLRPLGMSPHRIRSELVLVRGYQIPKQVVAFREHLAAMNGLPLTSVIMKENRQNHSRVFIDWVLQDTLADPSGWPGASAPGKSIAYAPLRFGVYEDGRYQERFGPAITEDMTDVVKRPEKNLSHLITEGMNGAGKALALDTPVPTPAGWTTMGEIRPGDLVFDEGGKPCRVTDAWDVRHGRPCYEIKFSDGSRVVADADHQWLVDTHKSRIADHNQGVKRGRRTADKPGTGYARYTWPVVTTTATMADSVRVRNSRHINYSVRVAAALDCPAAALPVPPYTLGGWLGDGTSASGQITTMDPEIIAAMEAEGETPYPTHARGRAWTYTVPGLYRRLRLAGLLGNKHIPMVYLRASEPQRRALLAGLLDTDGHCTPSGAVEFCNTNEALARAVLHLACGLGYKASLRSKIARLNGRDCGIAWTVSFTPADKVFRLPRKLARQVTTIRATAAHRYVVAAEPVPSVPVRCIAVDSPSHLFLVGESCIPTHNSTMQRALITDAASRPDITEWLIDTVKKFQTFGQLGGAFDWFATTKAEAKAMITFLAVAVIPGRAEYLGLRGLDNWIPGCGIPYLRVTIEEGGIIANDLDDLADVLNSARSTGTEINLSAQRAHHALVDTNVRAALGDSASFGCKEGDDAFAIPPDLAEAGADPAVWANKQPGMNYYAAADLDLDAQLIPGRAFNMKAAECREEIARWAPARAAYMEAECADWAALLAQIDRHGTYAGRTRGTDVLARIGAVQAAQPLPAVSAPAAVDRPPAVDQDRPPVVDAEPADDVHEAEVVPTYDEDDPVVLDELADELGPETAEAVAEDLRDGIDPRVPIEEEDPDMVLDLSPAEGTPAKPELTREAALDVVRSRLRARGAGWEFRLRDVYDDLCAATGRSASWVKTEIGGTLLLEGVVSRDRLEGKYEVCEPQQERRAS